MAKLIPAAERIQKAQKLIQKARDLPVPETGRFDLSYMAEVKDLLQQARDLVKFIPYRAAVDDELAAEAKQVLAEADQVNKDIFR